MSPRQKNIGFLSVAVTVTAALVLFASGTLFPGKTKTAQHIVHIRGMTFQPATLEIAAGDSVTWINEDILLHAVKSTDPANPWQSKDLQPRQSWTKIFSQGGPYFCPYHPPMTGKVVVIQGAAAPAVR